MRFWRENSNLKSAKIQEIRFLANQVKYVILARKFKLSRIGKNSRNKFFSEPSKMCDFGAKIQTQNQQKNFRVWQLYVVIFRHVSVENTVAIAHRGLKTLPFDSCSNTREYLNYCLHIRVSLLRPFICSTWGQVPQASSIVVRRQVLKGAQLNSIQIQNRNSSHN